MCCLSECPSPIEIQKLSRGLYPRSIRKVVNHKNTIPRHKLLRRHHLNRLMFLHSLHLQSKHEYGAVAGFGMANEPGGRSKESKAQEAGSCAGYDTLAKPLMPGGKQGGGLACRFRTQSVEVP